MKQAKRLIYLILLNIIISAGTIFTVLYLWERSHPTLPADSTPAVILVTPTQAVNLPIVSREIPANEIQPTDTGIQVTATVAGTPSIEMLVYVVKAGDTLGALAVQFNVSVADIMTVNGFTDPNSLYEGQTIHIPTQPLPTITPTPLPTIQPSATLQPSATVTSGPTATPSQTPPGGEAQVIIQTVIGAGVLANEHVVLQRTGEGQLSLAGWQLKDELGNTYTFPQLTLYKGGTINLNTRQGEDTVLDLFWGLPAPLWGPGKTVFVYDAQGALRASYDIP